VAALTERFSTTFFQNSWLAGNIFGLGSWFHATRCSLASCYTSLNRLFESSRPSVSSVITVCVRAVIIVEQFMELHYW